MYTHDYGERRVWSNWPRILPLFLYFVDSWNDLVRDGASWNHLLWDV
jgi:hypothetical protein